MQITNPSNIIAEYVWIDPDLGLHSKSKLLQTPDLAELNFDKSPTGNIDENLSDVFIRPKEIHFDPFNGGNNVNVMTECYENESTDKENQRIDMVKIMEKYSKLEPMCGIDRFDQKNNLPIGWSDYDKPQKKLERPKYCTVLGDRANFYN